MHWTRREFIATSCAAALARPAEAATVPIPFIDSHVHVWKHDPRYPFAAGANIPPEDASAEMLLDLMRANKVERTVIIQVIHYKWDNSCLADVLRRDHLNFPTPEDRVQILSCTARSVWPF